MTHMETVQFQTATYIPTDAGRKLIGTLLPMKRYGHTNASTSGVTARKDESADKYRARVMASIAKHRVRHGGSSHHYIGKSDGPYVMRETDGHRAAFEFSGEHDAERMRQSIAMMVRPVSFPLSAELFLAVRRAEIVSKPREFIRLSVGEYGIVVHGKDGEGVESSERVNTSDCVGAAEFTIDAGYLLDLFGRPNTIATVQAAQADKLFPSLAVDVDGWRYVVALAKS